MSVTYHFVGPVPTALASKIGSGTYLPQTLSSGDLVLSLPSGTTDFEVTYVCPPSSVSFSGIEVGQVTNQWVVRNNVADGTSFQASCDSTSSTPQTALLTGTVDATALPDASYLSVQAADGKSSLTTQLLPGKSDFSFDAPAGSDRVEVLAFSINAPSTLPGTSSLVAAKTFDDQSVPGILNGGSPVIFGETDRTSSATIAYQNVPSGYAAPTTAVFFNMANQSALTLALKATSSYPTLPVGAARSGDSYGFIATAYQGTAPGVPVGPAVLVQKTGLAAGPVTFTFPDPWNYGGPIPAALPTFEFTYAGFKGTSGVHRGAFLAWSGGAAQTQYTSTISASANYNGGSSTLVFPDLSALSGFLPAPSSGTQVYWLADIIQSDSAPLAHPAVESTGSYVVP